MMEVSDYSEETPLINKSERAYLGDEPPTVHSATSLNSLVDVRIEKLANVPEVILNSFKSFVGSGILGYLFLLIYFCIYFFYFLVGLYDSLINFKFFIFYHF